MNLITRMLLVLLLLSLTTVQAQESSSNRRMIQVQPQPVQTAAAFIKFDGVDGEARDTDHKGWIDVLSVSQGVSRAGKPGAVQRRRGDVKLEDITVTKSMDKASPKLAEAARSKTVFPGVEIHSPTDNGSYKVYKMKNVMVTSYSTGGSSDRPTETVTLNFAKVEVSYVQAGKGPKKGNVEANWKVEEGEK